MEGLAGMIADGWIGGRCLGFFRFCLATIWVIAVVYSLAEALSTRFPFYFKCLIIIHSVSKPTSESE
jgi:hypothetical protein